ncbi:Undecaprenyl-phosphate galactose phosphotransferase, WbaP/exopolysaccharide biosynthesis polyprenyl glycosylphosphotransferase [Desulfosporosinus hippei DSM 8344]|uniref:Undecaprenyl-phosphate galactose phosphotransferase, WbaP/exopolysaccharide biosynthesis polyprenyl glycosylphosphotransferase n=1 Tax=Desulfosporosinus hippei DSM 8344 TaxID=1121419 RepID=A0A1G8EVK5_9FIRM|nr:sugar transferase [Desulfosporosinus hippei]SDH73952.1 Undecaprenyl-phosphate galactose phosphotransferase, WbaP/exopolysaccharide biosynthesis polyprenyl glycosylphosphotransferase [Desulfosporosinus hippei DSM 8344]
MLRDRGIIENISELVDIVLIALSFSLAIEIYHLKYVLINDNWPGYFTIFLIYLVAWIIANNALKVYQSRRFMSARRELSKILKAHFFSFAVSMITINLYNPNLLHTRFFYYFEAFAVGLTIGMHILTRLVLQAGRKLGRNTRYVLILGAGSAAELYLQKLKDNPQLGYRVIGYIAPAKNGLEIPYLGDYSNLESIIRMNIVDLTVVTALITEKGVQESIEILDVMGKTVAVLLDDIVTKVSRSRPMDFGGLSMVVYDSHPRRPWHEAAKRGMDVILSGAGLMVLTPVFVLVALAIKLTSKGPIFFAQERVGLNGREFNIYKFRSMVVNAEELKGRLAHLNEMSGPVFKIANDPRVTAVGRFIRKTSIDELPQLYNVFRGDMSLVGPRPPLISEVNLYDSKHRKRLAVKPGITCIWQISGRNEVDFDQWMEMDAEYVDRWSLWLDMEILARTVPVVLLRKGAS